MCVYICIYIYIYAYSYNTSSTELGCITCNDLLTTRTSELKTRFVFAKIVKHVERIALVHIHCNLLDYYMSGGGGSLCVAPILGLMHMHVESY